MSTPDPTQQPQPQVVYVKEEKKSWYKKPGCMIPLGLVALIAIAAAAMGGDGESTSTSAKDEEVAAQQENASGENGEEAAAEENSDDGVPKEYKTALRKAESYSKTMHMSKQGIYDQLTSEYAEKYSPEAAQYAVDNMEADWNANALEKAKSYQDDMDMSPDAIYDQLTSDYGEKFTAEEAQYAVDNL
ncbi:Ltp family lipoprotein [Corynebacterium oculi]|uniref:Host cell surface-exposed lipoprotein n=1 Tax=Corynebacterium oculi TaxID=1544416 RepID=A0A0Q1AFE9_9CORY|nr:Ltp family lipoprotein [Corynebacterium oculi]KQB85368.1 Host cell surface-exposed lipoprotein [Corynebacterium oculi]